MKVEPYIKMKSADFIIRFLLSHEILYIYFSVNSRDFRILRH